MKLRKLFAYATLGLSIIGCSAATKRVHGEINGRLGFEPVIYNVNLGEALQTVPFNYEAPENGSSRTNLAIAWDLAPRGGLEFLLTNNDFGLNIGVDGRLSLTSLGHHAYRCANFDTTREPIVGESYSFTQLSPYYVDAMPFVGVYKKVDKESSLFVEIQAPYSGFQYLSGRDTYGKWVEYRSDKWNGFGIGARLGLRGHDTYIGGDEKPVFSIGIGYERYEPEFLGERTSIDAYTIFLNINGRLMQFSL